MKYFFTILLLPLVLLSCRKSNQEKRYSFHNENIQIFVDDNLDIRIQKKQDKATIEIPVQTATLELEDESTVEDFTFQSASNTVKTDKIGEYTLISVKGYSSKYNVEKKINLKVYKDYQDFFILNQSFLNKSRDTLNIASWEAQNLTIEASSDNTFWSFNGSSSEDRADWIQEVKPGFFKENYLGMNDSDYGGGIPVSATWRSDYGVAVGHTSLTPELVSLPISFEKESDYASLIVKKHNIDIDKLAPNDSYKLLESFVNIFDGDCFNSLQIFSNYMKAKGLQFAPVEEAAFEPIWCAWGYERNFTIDEILKSLPKVKELGYKWVVIDDGYQIEEGNWNVNSKTFPSGDKQMKELVDEIHKMGLKAKIWWTPLAIDMLSDKLKKHPEVLLRNPNESPQYITWWDAFYMSPSHPKTIRETRQAIDLFINKWGFDGFKMDGQHLNGIPPDYNPDIQDAEQAVRDLPQFFQMIYDETRAVKPNAVLENCPCGTCMSYYNMTSINQAVSSDPESSWQIRTKGKVYKALVPQMAYYGDHVELSDNADDFATSFGIGAVLGSKFTWPKDNPTVTESYLLTAEKEKVMKKWMNLYQKKMLSKGQYLGDLYDIGFDRPEAHVIRKDKILYYAFYANNFKGNIVLRGLSPDIEYTVVDYFNDKNYKNISKNAATIEVSFKQFLVLEVAPK